MRLLKIAFISIVLLSFITCNSSKNMSRIDNSSPEKVMQIIFDAAQTKQFDKLPSLLPSNGNHDGDCFALCHPGNKEMKKRAGHNYVTAEEFCLFFEKAQIIGEAQIEENKAWVKFSFGPNNEKREKMVMQKIDGKWYLESF